MDYLKKYLGKYFDTSIYSGNICPEVFVERLIKDNKINKLIVVKNNISEDVKFSLAGHNYEGEECEFFIDWEF